MIKKTTINLLIISHSSGHGGAEYSLLDLLKNINKEKFNPIVILPTKGPLEEELKKLNINYYCRFIDLWIPFSNVFGVKHLISFCKGLRGRLWSISHLIEQHNIDIIYTNTITPIDGALAAKKHNIPHIWHIREYPIGNNDIKSYLPFPHLIVNYLSTNIITNSKNLQGKIKSQLIKRPISVIYNGVNVDQNNYHLFLPPHPIKKHIITTVCAVTPRKDLKTFVHAAKILLESRNDISFLIVGDGDSQYIQSLKSLASSYSISPHIHFMGQREDALSIMKGSSIVTLTSKQEAFGRVIIEAMSVGTPVISTDSGGPAEIIENNIDGILISVGDADALSYNINKLLDSPELSEQFSSRGLQKSSQTFDIETYVNSIEKVVESTFLAHNNHG